MEIQFFNHHTKKVETEKVYGDQLIEWLYKSNSGQLLSHSLFKTQVSVQKKLNPLLKTIKSI